VLVRNPQIILKMVAQYSDTASTPSGYGATDTSRMEELRIDIMSRPGFDDIDAVENERIYLITSDASSVHPSIFNSYVAKWLHPELFEDIDPVAIHEEWLQSFLGIEYQGVYAYPLL
jgi:iron complex transport system substrate-binding protein